jgi:hypothetical protein
VRGGGRQALPPRDRTLCIRRRPAGGDVAPDDQQVDDADRGHRLGDRLEAVVDIDNVGNAHGSALPLAARAKTGEI